MQYKVEHIFVWFYAGYGINVTGVNGREIIILFSMCRHAHSCTFISVIELPRIPTYYPKKAITFYKLLFAIFSRFSLLFWHKNHVLCILNYLDLYPLSLQPQSDQAESRRETLQSINISLRLLSLVSIWTTS